MRSRSTSSSKRREKLSFNVTRCRYAEMYRALGLADLGGSLSCQRDFALAQGFNPAIQLDRTQTIMEGASHCDFRFRLDAASRIAGRSLVSASRTADRAEARPEPKRGIRGREVACASYFRVAGWLWAVWGSAAILNGQAGQAISNPEGSLPRVEDRDRLAGLIDVIFVGPALASPLRHCPRQCTP